MCQKQHRWFFIETYRDSDLAAKSQTMKTLFLKATPFLIKSILSKLKILPVFLPIHLNQYPVLEVWKGIRRLPNVDYFSISKCFHDFDHVQHHLACRDALQRLQTALDFAKCSGSWGLLASPHVALFGSLILLWLTVTLAVRPCDFCFTSLTSFLDFLQFPRPSAVFLFAPPRSKSTNLNDLPPLTLPTSQSCGFVMRLLFHFNFINLCQMSVFSCGIFRTPSFTHQLGSGMSSSSASSWVMVLRQCVSKTNFLKLWFNESSTKSFAKSSAKSSYRLDLWTTKCQTFTPGGPCQRAEFHPFTHCCWRHPDARTVKRAPTFFWEVNSKDLQG